MFVHYYNGIWRLGGLYSQSEEVAKGAETKGEKSYLNGLEISPLQLCCQLTFKAINNHV